LRGRRVFHAYGSMLVFQPAPPQPVCTTNVSHLATLHTSIDGVCPCENDVFTRLIISRRRRFATVVIARLLTSKKVA
jgi:hypothetical protein